MDLNTELKALDEILNFKVTEIQPSTRFWMIRTKKGYFYNEFINQGFVALAWNCITISTSFTEQAEENLRDTIIVEYPEIKRPKTVINKCRSFIHEVKEKDILVIPSAGSRYVTFAVAGEYYEETSKTVEIEKSVIRSIDSNTAVINEVSCPYRKRRRIYVVRTVRSEEINYNLYRAISNYHGISNLDGYARYILNMMYNVYSFNNDVNIIFNVRKRTPIGPRSLSGLLSGVTEYLCEIGVAEDKISTQVNINSPGPIDFSILSVYNWLKDNHLAILGIMVVLGGGNFLTFQLPGIPQIIKDICSLKTLVKREKLENDKLELEIYEKKVELVEKIKSAGIDPADLESSLLTICNNANALNVQPIETINETVNDETITDTLQEDGAEDE